MMHLSDTFHTGLSQDPNHLTVGKLIIRVRQVRNLLLRRWLKILTFGLLIALALTSYFYFKSPTYSAEISFALDDQQSDNLPSGLSELPSGLGFSQTVDPDGSIFSSLSNVVELIKSRLLIDMTLKTTVTIDQQNLTLADFFLDSLDYRKEWVTDRKYDTLYFDRNDTNKATMLYKNALLSRMYNVIIKKMISIDKKGKGTSIIGVTCTTEHELFSKYFVETLIANTENYYTYTRTQRSKLNLDFIEKRTDSVKNVYNSALYGKASFSDANLNPGRQVAVVSGEKQQTDVTAFRTTYIELMRALESSKAAYNRNTPLFQYIDSPILPLKRTAPPVLIYFILFYIVGILITSLWMLTNKWVSIVSNAEQASKSVSDEQEYD